MTKHNISFKPIRRLLIANRGEIAVRIIRTARKMGIVTIGITTNADPHTDADESAFLEGSSISETYLNADAIINLALVVHADAIHPGYGFLSENESFARKTADAGIIFVGPSPDYIREMGNKTNARKLAATLDIPLTRAIYGSVDEILSQQMQLAFPLLIKAAAGGGGKGMLLAHDASELKEKLLQTAREAKNYFGDDTVYAEQYIETPRHIEVQVLGDMNGNIVHLYERECSIQRRFQKIVEEAPAPFINESLRNKLTADAIRLCKAIGYYNAGTVEFLVDKNGQHYFLEMNTRLQVEHPVTEMITGIDLVEQQINIAMGLPLPFSQEKIAINGHSIECRIYAEDPLNKFHPAPGKIIDVTWPSADLARTETWFHKPIEILPDFDPMLAKIVTHGHSREIASEKMLAALSNTRLSGSVNNIGYLTGILNDPKFRAGETDTSFCDNFVYQPDSEHKENSFFSAAMIWHLYQSTGSNTTWYNSSFKRINNQTQFSVNDEKFLLEWENPQKKSELLFSINNTIHLFIENISLSRNRIRFSLNKKYFLFHWVKLQDGALHLENGPYNATIYPAHLLKGNVTAKRPDTNGANGRTHQVKAPIPGKIIEIKVREGDLIKKGDALVILEAMKMENRLNAMHGGIIKHIFSSLGQQVKADEVLIDFE
jgi:acetyl/propionyl-CoA carboxylase alpha subunit